MCVWILYSFSSKICENQKHYAYGDIFSTHPMLETLRDSFIPKGSFCFHWVTLWISMWDSWGGHRMSWVLSPPWSSSQWLSNHQRYLSVTTWAQPSLACSAVCVHTCTVAKCSLFLLKIFVMLGGNTYMPEKNPLFFNPGAAPLFSLFQRDAFWNVLFNR